MALRPGGFFDARLETMPEPERRAWLGARLAETVRHAWAAAPRTRRTLESAGLGPSDVRGLDDLARIPRTRKDDLPALQAAEAPFGGLAGVPLDRLARVFMSPGPIYDPQGAAARPVSRSRTSTMHSGWRCQPPFSGHS